jgi:predicted DNA binding CopG/RHH family protein
MSNLRKGIHMPAAKSTRKTQTGEHSAHKTSDRETSNSFLEASKQRALEQVQAELEAAGEAQARHTKYPKDAFLGKSRTKPVAVRFDEFTLERLRTLAARRNTGYQTLLKEFVVERLYEEEKREGIID